MISGSGLSPSDLGTELGAIEQRERILGNTMTKYFMDSPPLLLPLTGTKRAKKEAMAATSPHSFSMPTFQCPHAPSIDPNTQSLSAKVSLHSSVLPSRREVQVVRKYECAGIH